MALRSFRSLSSLPSSLTSSRSLSSSSSFLRSFTSSSSSSSSFSSFPSSPSSPSSPSCSFSASPSPSPSSSPFAQAGKPSKSSKLSPEFLRAIPKTDLHVHLDGSVRIQTILDVAREENIQLPALPDYPGVPQSEWTTDMMGSVFKHKYASLVEYLLPYEYTIKIMQSRAALERVAYEYAMDCISQNVLYTEVRFAPQLHSHSGQDVREVIKATDRGLERAKREYNMKQPGGGALFDYGIICCGMRIFDHSTSDYFKYFCNLMPNTPPKKRSGLASQALVYEMTKARREDGIPVVALDIAGPEAGFPAVDHAEAFRIAHKNFFRATVHAGEAYGPESIYQAVTDLYASRIGHGFHIFDAHKIADPKIKDKQRYVDELLSFVADSKITLEVCLSSNLQTLPELNYDVKSHNLGKMLEYGINVSICTDGTLLTRTNVSRELGLAVEAFDIKPDALKALVMNGFENAFFAGSAQEKHKYIESMRAQYLKVEREYGI